MNVLAAGRAQRFHEVDWFTRLGTAFRDTGNAMRPELAQSVDLDALRALLADGSLDPACVRLAAYWGGLTVAGLLLMPPTRHAFVHLNERMEIRMRRKI